jgi:hypothetical protein
MEQLTAVGEATTVTLPAVRGWLLKVVAKIVKFILETMRLEMSLTVTGMPTAMGRPTVKPVKVLFWMFWYVFRRNKGRYGHHACGMDYIRHIVAHIVQVGTGWLL